MHFKLPKCHGSFNVSSLHLRVTCNPNPLKGPTGARGEIESIPVVLSQTSVFEFLGIPRRELV